MGGGWKCGGGADGGAWPMGGGCGGPGAPGAASGGVATGAGGAVGCAACAAIAANSRSAAARRATTAGAGTGARLAGAAGGGGAAAARAWCRARSSSSSRLKRSRSRRSASFSRRSRAASAWPASSFAASDACFCLRSFSIDSCSPARVRAAASASRSSVARSCARRSGRVAAEASRSSRFAPAPLGASRGGSSPPRCWDRTAFSSSARRWSTIVLWCCRPLKTRWSSAPSRGAGDAAASSCVTRKRPRVTARAAAGGIAPPRPDIFCGAYALVYAFS